LISGLEVRIDGRLQKQMEAHSSQQIISWQVLVRKKQPWGRVYCCNATPSSSCFQQNSPKSLLTRIPPHMWWPAFRKYHIIDE